ncbi:MAG: ATP-binding cassette domain-containing protein, partial [Sedimentibacter sp.]
MEIKLDIEKLTFKYNSQTPVFKDISFSMEEGDSLFLLGPNGTGKTTLFKVI